MLVDIYKIPDIPSAKILIGMNLVEKTKLIPTDKTKNLIEKTLDFNQFIKIGSASSLPSM